MGTFDECLENIKSVVGKNGEEGAEIKTDEFEIAIKNLTIEKLIKMIKTFPKKEYDLRNHNCQTFVKFIYDKLTDDGSIGYSIRPHLILF